MSIRTLKPINPIFTSSHFICRFDLLAIHYSNTSSTLRSTTLSKMRFTIFTFAAFAAAVSAVAIPEEKSPALKERSAQAGLELCTVRRHRFVCY